MTGHKPDARERIGGTRAKRKRKRERETREWSRITRHWRYVYKRRFYRRKIRFPKRAFSSLLREILRERQRERRHRERERKREKEGNTINEERKRRGPGMHEENVVVVVVAFTGFPARKGPERRNKTARPPFVFRSYVRRFSGERKVPPVPLFRLLLSRSLS